MPDEYANTAPRQADTKPDITVPDNVAFRTADILSEGTRMAVEVFAPR